VIGNGHAGFGRGDAGKGPKAPRQHPYLTQHRPRRACTGPDVPPAVSARAWRAQVRLHHRHRSLTTGGKRSTVATVAVARELCGFLWAAMTHQPLRDSEEVAAA
jgi:hypothetical protein